MRTPLRIRCPSGAHARLAALRDERGFTVVEVVVSAAILLVVSAGVLALLETASRASGRDRSRTIAGSLAQRDQERLRALRIADLGNRNEERLVPVGDVTYTVRSQGQFVSGDTGSVGCTAAAQPDLIKIVSTVSWPAMGARRPVRIESLVNPPVGSMGADRGSVVLKVTTAAGSPVRGLLVTLAGPAAYTQITSDQGCVFFANVPVGPYSLAYSLAEWVDPALAQASGISSLNVLANQTASYQTEYDMAGALDVRVFTRRPGAAVDQAATTPSLTLMHARIPGEVKSFTIADPTVVPTRIGGLYPFAAPSPYAVQTGTCRANALPDGLFAQVSSGGYQRQAQVTPNGVTTVKVFEPALAIRVRGDGAAPLAVQGAAIVLKEVDPGCETTQTFTADAQGRPVDAGRAADPGQPYGTYHVCAEAKARNGLWTKAEADVVNDSAQGKDVVLTLPSTPTGDARCAR